MTDLATVPKSELVKQNKSLKHRLSRIRDASAKGTEELMGAALGGAGGALAGVLTSKYPNIANTGVDAGLAAGVAAIGLALAGGAGKQKEAVLEAGSGMIAFSVGLRAWKAFEKKAGRSTF